jgi:hypothetical protein
MLFPIAALAAAVFIDTDLKIHRRLALYLLALALVQTGEGAGVVQSGLYFAATALHLVVALLMLLATGGMWVNEGESP